jgi:ferric-dicitrate binding protein FerR (iron transport regulator)
MTPADIVALDSLVSRIVDGVQTADDGRALADLLAHDAEALRRYRRLMAVHTSLHLAYASVAAQSAVVPRSPDCGIPRDRKRRISRAAAVLVLLAGLGVGVIVTMGVVSFRNNSAVEQAAAPRSESPLATVAQTRFVAATATGEPLMAGQPLGSGGLQILGGAVALELRNGVELLVEGPADLDLLSDMQAVLRSGTIVVKMPKGMSGFRVETTSTDILDLGTEFAVKVGADSQTDVQVYDGAVLAAAKSQAAGGGFPRRLEAGEAARFAPGGDRDAVILPYDGDRFIRRLPKDRGIEHRVPVSLNDSAVRREIERQFGRPEHESLIVSRPHGPVVIDGALDEWAEAPGFLAWLGGDHAAAESVHGRMMYDAERLYIAARVADPAPLLSRIDPALDPDDGWRGGAIQVRLSTDRSLGWPVDANAPNYYRMRGLQPGAADKQAAVNPRLAHLTMWYHAASRQPCLTIRHGMMTGETRVNPSGFEGAFAKTADGLGYTVEYAISWRLLNCDRAPPQPGDALGVSWQVHFSDDDGRLWRTQILDVRNSDELPRIYTWERAATWGRAEYR